MLRNAELCDAHMCAKYIRGTAVETSLSHFGEQPVRLASKMRGNNDHMFQRHSCTFNRYKCRSFVSRKRIEKKKNES